MLIFFTSNSYRWTNCKSWSVSCFSQFNAWWKSWISTTIDWASGYCNSYGQGQRWNGWHWWKWTNASKSYHSNQMPRTNVTSNQIQYMYLSHKWLWCELFTWSAFLNNKNNLIIFFLVLIIFTIVFIYKWEGKKYTTWKWITTK